MSERDERYMSEINRLEGERDYLQAKVKELAAAVLSLRDLWPVERWATLSAICRDHPVIEREYCRNGTTRLAKKEEK
jgi:hypothetical protein